MKVSAFNWLLGAIALPLFITILNGSNPVNAEQLDRSRHRTEESTSAVTDLNLAIPVEVTIATDKERQRSPLKQSVRNSSVITKISVSKERTNRTKSSLTKPRTTTIILPSISISNESSSQTKSNRSRDLVVASASSALTITKERRRPKSNFKHNIATVSRAPFSGNYLRLVRDLDKGTNDLGNPIYTLEIYIDGELERKFNAVSGTKRSQKTDRNIGNNNAPLPDGLYDVNNWITMSDIREVDRTFVGIRPKFKTNRNDLGIHLDPSFNKRNGYDGTSGCIGLTTPEDRDALNNFIIKHHPRNLIVNISSKELSD
jgi:hypothetical protein